MSSLFFMRQAAAEEPLAKLVPMEGNQGIDIALSCNGAVKGNGA